MFAAKILISLAALSLLSTSLNQAAECRSEKATKRHSETKAAAQSDDAAVHSKITALKNCVINQDAKAMAKLWTEEGTYLDDDGNRYKGREALEKTFSSIFQENGKQQVDIVTNVIRFPASNVALVDGTVKHLDGREYVPMTVYSMVLEKKNGEWLISAAIETAVNTEVEVTNSLENLDWLIGDWTAEHAGSSAVMKAEWVPSHKFIFCEYQIKKPNEAVQVETQVIGWDPRSKAPISWNFDSSGGFGQGSWSKTNNQWLVNSTGLQRDGSLTDANNIFTILGPNSFTWQSTNRHLNGLSLANTLPLKVTRVGK